MRGKLSIFPIVGLVVSLCILTSLAQDSTKGHPKHYKAALIGDITGQVSLVGLVTGRPPAGLYQLGSFDLGGYGVRRALPQVG